MRKAKSKTGESTSSASHVEEDIPETAGETSATYDESMSASLEGDFQSAVSEAQASHNVPEILLTTPASCPNCAALTKENRKLSNSIKTMREAAKKRRAEIRKLQKKGTWPLYEDIYIILHVDMQM